MLHSFWQPVIKSAVRALLEGALGRERGGNSLRAYVAEPLEARVLLTTPVLASINRTTPAGAYTNASSVVYTATFNTPVSGVDAADFKVFLGGNLYATTPVVVGGGGAAWTVTINGIHGNGNLRLDLIDNNTIAGQSTAIPLGGTGVNNGSFQGQSYSVLQAGPQVLSINRTTPAATSTTATSVVYTVTFSCNVTGVDAGDFSLALSGATTSAPLVSGSGSVYTVTINSITGVGTLGLNLVDNGTIRDVDGNPLQDTGTASFAAQSTFATGSGPVSVTTADVNGDGKADLIVANRNTAGGTVGVLLGNGNGTFAAQVMYAVGTTPLSVVAADVNDDGKADVVTANFNHSVSVLLGNGDGTFQAQVPYAVTTPQCVAAADVNGDGKADLIIVTVLDNISVLLGKGDGTFLAPVPYAAGPSPLSVIAADVNGDGKADMITVNPPGNTVGVLLGNGDGTFQTQVSYVTGSDPRSVTVADVNGDGNADLITANAGGNTVSVLLGNGNGTFEAQVPYATRPAPLSVTTVDVNGDGKADLITANQFGNVSVLLGNGNGTFQSQVIFDTGLGSQSVAAADLNGDGRPDLVTANFNANNVSILLGNGGGTFPGQVYAVVPPVQVSAETFFYQTAQFLVLTFNRDIGASLANTDLVLKNLTTNTTVPSASINLSYSPNSGTFTFASILADGNYRATLPAGSVQDLLGNPFATDFTLDFFVLAGDANGDRSVDFADLVAVAQNYGKIGDATAALGDFNYDKNVDFADLVTVAQKYGSKLAAPAAPVASPAVPLVPLASAALESSAVAARVIPLKATGHAPKPVFKPTAATGNAVPLPMPPVARPAGPFRVKRIDRKHETFSPLS